VSVPSRLLKLCTWIIFSVVLRLLLRFEYTLACYMKRVAIFLQPQASAFTRVFQKAGQVTGILSLAAIVTKVRGKDKETLMVITSDSVLMTIILNTYLEMPLSSQSTKKFRKSLKVGAEKMTLNPSCLGLGLRHDVCEVFFFCELC
jgi:hypothetical protein